MQITFPLISNKPGILNVYFQLSNTHSIQNPKHIVRLSIEGRSDLSPLIFKGRIKHTPHATRSFYNLNELVTFDLREKKGDWFRPGNVTYIIETNAGDTIDSNHATYRKLKRTFKIINQREMILQLVDIQAKDTPYFSDTEIATIKSKIISYITSTYPNSSITIKDHSNKI